MPIIVGHGPDERFVWIAAAIPKNQAALKSLTGLGAFIVNRTQHFEILSGICGAAGALPAIATTSENQAFAH